LQRMGVEIVYFTIEGKGMMGYLKNRKLLIKQIQTFNPDIIHAHYGLSGLLANLQRRVPVVTTYHGSDINDAKVYRFSKICIRLSALNVFVSEKHLSPDPSLTSSVLRTPSPDVEGKKAPTPLKSPLRKGRNRNVLIPCGVDVELFVPVAREEARMKMRLDQDKKYVLFAGAFDNKVKNSGLALEAVSLLSNVELLELKGYSREEVVLLMNAVDVVLMTSFTEGSPQFIKEAMACNCPVVSVAVGDVPEVIAGIDGCYISNYDPADVADKLKRALAYNKRTNGREVIAARGLELMIVAKRLVEVYEFIVRSL
jgi:teichuronic acid biosynthesis glycosyltransferase TuaC